FVARRVFRDRMRFPRSVATMAALIAVGGAAQHRALQSVAAPAKFVDVTSALGVKFQHAAPHTTKKYLIETMGSGVALFDYDNDGRLDLFLVNGAEINDPSPAGAIPQKTGPKYW